MSLSLVPQQNGGITREMTVNDDLCIFSLSMQELNTRILVLFLFSSKDIHDHALLWRFSLANVFFGPIIKMELISSNGSYSVDLFALMDKYADQNTATVLETNRRYCRGTKKKFAIWTPVHSYS